MTDIPPIRNERRSATSALRGYLYQCGRIAHSWLQLEANELLVCEGNEDFDLHVLDADGKISRSIECQVKQRSAPPAGEQIAKVLLQFFEGFLAHRRAGRSPTFIFSSTAAFARAREGSWRSLLAAWQRFSHLTDPGERADEKRKLATSVRKFLGNRTDGRVARGPSGDDLFAAFVEAVVWEFGSTSWEETRQRAIDLIVDLPEVSSPPALVFERLVYEVLRCSAEKDIADRVLDHSGLARVIGEGHAELSEQRTTLGLRRLSSFLSPFRTVDEHFHGDAAANQLDNHRLECVGRKNELSTLREFVAGREHDVLILSAPPGSGKSKLTHTLASERDSFTEVTIRFLDPLVIPDEAHLGPDFLPDEAVICLDRPDLHNGLTIPGLLVRGARCKLIIEEWPPNTPTLQRRLSEVGISQDRQVVLSLDDLSEDAAYELALASLGPRHRHAALALAERYRSSPFAIVVGGRLVSQGQVAVHALSQHSEFSERVLDHLAKLPESVSAEFPAASAERSKDLVPMLAAIGHLPRPPHPSFSAASNFLEVDADQLQRILGKLEHWMVVKRRGSGWSLRSDPAALRIAQKHCCLDSGSTGFAERLVDEFGWSSGQTVLQTLAEIAGLHEAAPLGVPFEALWMLLTGDILDLIAGRRSAGRVAELSAAELIRIAGTVGFWRPEDLLSLARSVLRDENDFSDNVADALCAILEPIVYRPDAYDELLRVAWEIKKRGADVNLLGRLAKYEPRKPSHAQYSVLRFVRSRLALSTDSKEVIDLIGVLSPAVAWSGSQILSVSRTRWVSQTYTVPAVPTLALRAECRVIAKQLLRHQSAEVRGHALDLMSSGFPRGNPEDAPVDEIEARIKNQLAWIRLLAELEPFQNPAEKLRTISVLEWHANRGYEIVKKAALPLLTQLLAATDVEMRAALAGQHSLYVERGQDSVGSQFDDWARVQAATYAEKYPTAIALSDALTAHHGQLRLAKSTILAPELFLRSLSSQAPDLVIEVCSNLGLRDSSVVPRFAGSLLAPLCATHSAQVGIVFDRLAPTLGVAELENLVIRLLTSSAFAGNPVLCEHIFEYAVAHPERALRVAAGHALHIAASGHPKLALRLAWSLDVGCGRGPISSVSQLFVYTAPIELKSLDQEELRLLFDQLIDAGSIDADATLDLLAKTGDFFPMETGRVLLQRVKRETRHERSTSYQALPLTELGRLHFDPDDLDRANLLDEVWSEATRPGDSLWGWIELFWFFAGTATRGGAFLAQKARSGGLSIVMAFVCQGPPGITLRHPDLIDACLEAASISPNIEVLARTKKRIAFNAASGPFALRQANYSDNADAVDKARELLEGRGATDPWYSFYAKLPTEIESAREQEQRSFDEQRES